MKIFRKKSEEVKPQIKYSMHPTNGRYYAKIVKVIPITSKHNSNDYYFRIVLKILSDGRFHNSNVTATVLNDRSDLQKLCEATNIQNIIDNNHLIGKRAFIDVHNFAAEFVVDYGQRHLDLLGIDF